MAKLEFNFNSPYGGAGLFYGEQPEIPTDPDDPVDPNGDPDAPNGNSVPPVDASGGKADLAGTSIKGDANPKTGDSFPLQGTVLIFGIAIVLLILLVRARYVRK